MIAGKKKNPHGIKHKVVTARQTEPELALTIKPRNLSDVSTVLHSTVTLQVGDVLRMPPLRKYLATIIFSSQQTDAKINE